MEWGEWAERCGSEIWALSNVFEKAISKMLVPVVCALVTSYPCPMGE